MKLEFKFLWKIGFILIIALVIFYIFQLREISEAIDLMEDYSKKLEELSQKRESLEIKLSQMNSLGNLEVLVAHLGLEKVEKIDYLEIPAMVVKK